MVTAAQFAVEVAAEATFGVGADVARLAAEVVVDERLAPLADRAVHLRVAPAALVGDLVVRHALGPEAQGGGLGVLEGRQRLAGAAREVDAVKVLVGAIGGLAAVDGVDVEREVAIVAAAQRAGLAPNDDVHPVHRLGAVDRGGVLEEELEGALVGVVGVVGIAGVLAGGPHEGVAVPTGDVGRERMRGEPIAGDRRHASRRRVGGPAWWRCPYLLEAPAE